MLSMDECLEKQDHTRSSVKCGLDYGFILQLAIAAETSALI